MKTKFIDKNLLTINDKSGKVSLFGLAVPFFLESVFISLLGVVNTVILARFNEEYVSAITVAGQLISFFITVFGIITTGLSITLSLNLGKGDGEKGKKLIGVSLVFTLIVCLAVGIGLSFLSEPLLAFMNLKSSLIPVASKYLKIRCITMFISMMTGCFTTALRCYGYAKPTVTVGVVSNIVNLLFSYVAIYKPINLFQDEVKGLAYACVIAQLVGFIVAYLIFKSKKIKVVYFKDLKLIKKIFSIGIPGTVSAISYTISQVLTSSIIALLATTYFNAKIYISQIVYYVNIFGFSVGQATAIMIGRVCGSGDLKKADALHAQNLRIVLLCNTVLSLLVAILRKPLLSIYTSDPLVFKAANYIFFIDILVEFGRGMNHIGQYGLNGAGDVKFTTVVSILSCWVNGVVLAYVFAIVCGWGLVGIWIAFTIDELFRGICYLVRFKRGKWKYRLVNKNIV